MPKTEEERLESNRINHRKAQRNYRLKHGEALLEKQRQWQKKYDDKRRGIGQYVVVVEEIVEEEQTEQL